MQIHVDMFSKEAIQKRNKIVIDYALRKAHNADRSKQSKQVMDQRKINLILKRYPLVWKV
tara:strand:+ start:607 stop:786 length:180 start_codon:yes stop_codon:yes gene_type:complete